MALQTGASATTLISTFVTLASDHHSAQWPFIECGEDVATYGQVLAISKAIAKDILSPALDSARRVSRPIFTVAIISQNHPYTLAVMLGVWLLGGTVAPMDYHAPRQLMEEMLKRVEPCLVVIPTSDSSNVGLAKELSLKVHTFDPAVSTIPQLISRFWHDADVNLMPRVNTKNDTLALLLFTSSATSVDNLKCVPLSHASIYSNAVTQLSWLRSIHGFPEHAEYFEQGNRRRVLGWAPWSHIMGFVQDIAAYCILSGGVYVFGIVPSGSPAGDLAANLLQTAIKSRTNAVGTVPSVLRKFMDIEKSSGDARITTALKAFDPIFCGGAATDKDIIQWAEKLNVNLGLGIGMTELGGGLFHNRVTSDFSGSAMHDSLIPDVKITLINEDGEEDQSEGELVVSSQLISTGYYNHPKPNSAFSVDSDGFTRFRTGDIYSRKEDRLNFLDRKEDYIPLTSGEILDPRPHEAEMNRCPGIARACLVGDNFLKGPSNFICAIIEMAGSASLEEIRSVARAVANVNRNLAPPLRILLSRVLIVDDGSHIPMTRKGSIWRKFLEEKFGKSLAALLADPKLSRLRRKMPSDLNGAQYPLPANGNGEAAGTWSRSDVEHQVQTVVSGILCQDSDSILDLKDMTFAELGMDSQSALRIVAKLNSIFKLKLPANTCHDYIDLRALTDLVCNQVQASANSAVTVDIPSSLNYSRTETQLENEVVVIGQALRLPGGITDAASFWTALIDRREDLLTRPQRWDHASFYNPSNDQSISGTYNFDKIGFIPLESYDPLFFGITRAEALSISPATRLVLELSVEALQDANIPMSLIKGSNAGVFVAAGPSDGYTHLLWEDRGYEAYNRYHGTGVANSASCGRLSYFLDVHGPSEVVDTACSGGLVAFDHAVRHIKGGDGELSIVCAANTHLWPAGFAFLAANKMASPDGRCATFTKDANGYAPSEGAVALVLKSRSAAERDGDRILGIVRSTAVSHNGRSQGLVAPNSKSQVALQRRVLEKARLVPSDIDFIEAHGTGTAIGDLLESQAINEVFAGSHLSSRPLVVGAAKTVVGHTESAAGLVGVSKALLTFAHRKVPGLAHLTEMSMNPEIDTRRCPLKIPHDTVQLDHSQGGNGDSQPLRGEVLAYGFAGTISATILEEYRSDPIKHNSMENVSPWHLFVISAKTGSALREYCVRCLDYAYTLGEAELADFCYTACIGRDHFKHRFSCVVSTASQLITELQAYLQTDGGFATKNHVSIIFGFPGQGSQHQGMAKALCLHDATFERLVRNAATQASHILGHDIAPYLLDIADPASTKTNINDTDIAQVCIFLFQYCLAQWLMNLGVKPDGVLPHSFGEIAASATANAMAFDTALQFTVMRSRAMRPQPDERGGMLAVRASADTIQTAIQRSGLDDNVCIAAFNGGDNHAISGDEWAIDEMSRLLSSHKIASTKLAVNQGFHSHCVDDALAPIGSWMKAQASEMRMPGTKYYSSAFGRIIDTNETFGAEYWVGQARNPILFSDAATAAMKDETTLILDIGPQASLSTLLRQLPESSDVEIVSATAKKGKDQVVALMQATSALYRHGVTIDFVALFEGRREKFRKIPFPTYPWQRQRYYPSLYLSRNQSRMQPPAISTPKDAISWMVEPEFLDVLADHAVNSQPLLPSAAMVLLAAENYRKGALDSLNQAFGIRFIRPMIFSTETRGMLRFLETGSGASIVYESFAEETVEKHVISSVSPGVHISPSSTAMKVSTNPVRVVSGEDHQRGLVGGVVKFGPRFLNLVSVQLWETHADGTIQVESSSNLRHDMIRQLDSCITMMSALFKLPPLGDGSFLPSSLDTFQLYRHEWPSKITCRYTLPVRVEANFRKITASFDVLNDAGEIIASCRGYSVAWIPASVPFPQPPNSGITKQKTVTVTLFDTVWTHKTIPDTAGDLFYNRVVYIGTNNVLQFSLTGMFQSANVDFTCVSDWEAIGREQSFFDRTSGRTIVLLDISSFGNETARDVIASSKGLLSILKGLVVRAKWIASVVLITKSDFLPGNSSVPKTEGVLEPVQRPVYNSAVQAMFRVLRNENEESDIWSVNLPYSSPANSDARVIFDEISSRIPKGSNHAEIAYRMSENGSPGRLVSQLCPRVKTAFLDPPVETPLKGYAVIIGAGDIGSALADGMLDKGATGIVFVGRRAESHPEIIRLIRRLQEGHPSATILYFSTDVSDYEPLKEVVARAIASIAPNKLEMVVHTAAVIKDSLIINTNEHAFEQVLSPKIHGAWNLHTLDIELNLDVRYFVLLSSVSVPLGNPGQVSYVAANAYMDALASYRAGLFPSRRSVSLQLGPWESRLIEGRDFEKAPLEPFAHREGIPLLLKEILEGDRAVCVLAKLKPERMAKMHGYGGDPFFSTLFEGLHEKETNGNQGLAVSKRDVESVVESTLRTLLDIGQDGHLDLSETFSALGVDSITFTQLRGSLMDRFKINVPVTFLSEEHVAVDVVDYILKSAAK